MTDLSELRERLEQIKAPKPPPPDEPGVRIPLDTDVPLEWMRAMEADDDRE